MKVSKIIIEKILNDNEFSIELAKRLGNQQQSVLGLARRNSRNLTLWEAVMFYKEKGFTEEQIFEKDPIGTTEDPNQLKIDFKN
jgi:hypothetical protein